MDVHKIVIVGSGSTGKSSLYHRYSSGSFENTQKGDTDFKIFETILDGSFLSFGLMVPPGQEDFYKLRSFAYYNVTALILCYSVIDQASFESISEYWIPEIQKDLGPLVPIVLVATKIDLRNNDNSETVISKAKGEKLAKRLRASKFIECSAKENIGIKDVIEGALRASVESLKLIMSDDQDRRFSCRPF